MQAQSRSRKRAAPGASPNMQQEAGVQQPSFQYGSMQDSPFNNIDALGGYRNPLGNDTTVNSYDNFNPLDPNYFNPTLNGGQSQTFGANAPAPAPTPAPPHPSNQLVRRDTNQQLTTRTPQRSQWTSFSNNNNNNQRPADNRVWENMEEDEEQDVDTKAAIAKKDAQAKRKQIPPFVQKLSRYERRNNTAAQEEPH